MATPAYDLSIYEKRKRPEISVVDKPLSPRPKSQKRSVSLAVKFILTVAVILTFAALSIYGNVRRTELSDQLNTIQASIAQVENENKKLEAKLDSQLSLKRIEEEATRLGLSKTEKYQIVYVSLSGGDKVEIPKEVSENQSQLAELYANILEYFSS